MYKAVRFTAPFAAAALALSLSGCFDGNSSSSDSVSSVVSGVAQKGPMIAATVTIHRLDDSGARSGENAGGTTNANGYYEISVPWEGPSEVVAEGAYVDELTGAPALDSVSLRAFASVADASTTICNLNMLVHLATARAGELLANDDSLAFDAALDAAAAEVATAFGLSADVDLDALDVTDGSGTQSADNAHLLLLSAATAKQAVDDSTAATSDLLADLEADIVDDGLLNGAGGDALEDIGNAAGFIDLDNDIAITGDDLPDSTDLGTEPAWTNHAPVAASVAAQATDEDSASAAITLAGTDSDGDSLQVEVTTGPANGSLNTSAGGAPLNVVYTPNANYHGSDSFSYRVNDASVDSAEVTVSITVNPVNDAPVAASVAAQSTSEDTASAPITLDGSDPEGDSLQVEVTAGPANGVLSASSGTAPLNLVYTPAPNYTGGDSFSYRVSDGSSNSGTVTVSLSVTPVNDVPVAAGMAPQSTDEDTSAAAVVLGGSDVDGNSLQVEVVSGPSNGALDVSTGTAPLSVVYTPAANYNGSDSFTYRVFDGIAYSNTESVAFTVNPVNDAPVATAVSTVTTNEDVTSAAFDLTGTDVENDTLTVEIVTNPSNGGLVYSGTSAPLSVTYVPSADYNGSDSFQFRLNDGNGGLSDTETVNLSVTAVNDAPVFGTVSDQNASKGNAFSVTVAATDADGDTLTYSSTGTALPSWATLDTASGEISGTPNASGTTSGIEISAGDGTTTVASNTFNLAVADGASCAHILGANPAAADGVYLVDPDGSGGVAPFNVYCDMTTDGGGWAKIYQYPTRFFNSSTDSVGNIAVATNTVEAKLSDGQINAFQTLSGANGSVFRMAGDKHPSEHKLYVRSSGTWQDDVPAFQLFNPQVAAGNNLAACLAADWASCNLGNYTHADFWLDTLRMGGGNLPTPDNTARYFIDHSTQPRCWNNGVYPERCFATGASAGNAPIGDFTLWIRPHFVTDTFSFTETAGDDVAPTDLRDFFQALVDTGEVSNADWLLFDLPGATAENGGTCMNNAAWALDKYLFYYGGTATFVTYAGDGVDPDDAATDYSGADGTTGLQVWAYRSSDPVQTWDQETIPVTGIRHFNPRYAGDLGGWGPNYCTIPTTGTDLCLVVRPAGTGADELWHDGVAGVGTTLTIKVGRGGASRMDVCGF